MMTEERGDLMIQYHHYNYYSCKKSVLPLRYHTKNSHPICNSHFHFFLSLSLHYRYHHYDRSQHYYPNCSRHRHNIMQLMTASRCGEKGRLNADK